MTPRELRPTKPLLARKGAAAPADSRVTARDPQAPSLHPVDRDHEIADPPAKADGPAELPSRGAEKRTLESAPAASLLPIDLRRQTYGPNMPPHLAKPDPDIALADVSPAGHVEPATDARPIRRSGLRLRPKRKPAAPPPPFVATATDAGPRGKVFMPPPDPNLRVGVDAKGRVKRRASGRWRLPVGALAAVCAALVVGWGLANRDDVLGLLPILIAPEPDSAKERPAIAAPSPDRAAPVVVGAPPPIAEIQPPPEGTPTVPPAATASPLEARLPAPVLNMPADTNKMPIDITGMNGDRAASKAPESATGPAPDLTQAAAAPPATPSIDSAKAGADAPAPIKPSVDLVRLEANGEAVIAGRAAPNSELIVLDKGKPIGTVRADAFGEWVFVPEAALPPGDHEFGLVLKTVTETVILPAPAEPSSELAAAGPAVAGTKPAEFVVQLASVKSRAGAEEEWRKLQQRFPDILADKSPVLDEVTLADHGTVVRIRTGGFSRQDEAANLCAQFTAKRQECLVVKISGGN